MSHLTQDQEERIVQAFEQIGLSMKQLYDLSKMLFERLFPEPKERSESTVTHVKTAEEALREDQGDTDETNEEWIGLREKEFVEKGDAKAGRSKG